MPQPNASASSPAHALSVSESLAQWGTPIDQGLTAQQVEAARQRYGRNALEEAPSQPWWRRLLAQFQELVIWILLAAAIISAALQEWIDAAAIVAIVILNAMIGFFQEERAERALSALQKLSSPMARVLRQGTIQAVPAVELVPGDLIQLEAGDNIPADARLLRTFSLSVQEAALTGESTPVDKDAEAPVPVEASLGDRRTMVYLGTVATTGKATALVTSTGMDSELGHIAGLLQRTERELTPLQRRLEELGRILIVLCLSIVVVILGLQLLRGGNWVDALLSAVSLAVAAVPEGLPAVVTITLALGLQRMVKRSALVRKLPSVETLGSVTVICSDKTGTLTRNEMTVRELAVGHSLLRVSGIGYAPHGTFSESHEPNDPAVQETPIDLASRPDVIQLLTIGAVCNNAQVVPRQDGVEGWQVLGDPTEGALIVLAAKAQIKASSRTHALLHELPFDSTRKAMSVVVRAPDGSTWMFAKGAPEVLLSKSVAERIGHDERPLSEERRRDWLRINSEMASRALRVLALAYRPLASQSPGEATEDQLVFAGLVGMIDPPREEVRDAVGKCREAGIRPVMITGDHPETAQAVARELTIISATDEVVTGVDLDRITDDELTQRVDRISVYARVSAEHKLRVVDAWKKRGQVVAMTGDGVNDAPAVRAADIGIAMGITGTDVTKEASDMILMDDNFTSIVNAIEEGRGIFDNIQKVLQFLLSCNLGEILLMLVASLLGWPLPLLPIHLLWINLVTDGLPALALSLEPPEPGVMKRQPRNPNESILSWSVSWAIVVQGLLVGGVAIGAFAWFYRHPDDLQKAQTITFCVVVFSELLRAIAARSQTWNAFQLGFFSNPALLLAIGLSGLLQIGVVMIPAMQSVFAIYPHVTTDWLVIALAALIPVSGIELAKTLVRSMKKAP